jgi:hypothetical protein
MTARISMRPLKLSLAALATVVVVAAAGFRFAGAPADGGAHADASSPAMMAMPVPVVPVVRKTLPIYLDYPGRIESIRSIALQARVSGTSSPNPPRTAPTSRPATPFTRSIRATFRPCSTRRTRRHSATKPRSNMRAQATRAAKNW